jgi:hypothetical protein
MSSIVVDISTHCWVLKEHAEASFFLGNQNDKTESSVIPRDVVPAGAVAVVWSCVLFENCTVDASIFVCKCVRAYGGCLGTRSR